MRFGPALSGFFGAVLCATATANNFSVSGPGGAIPDCPNSPGTWNSAPTWPVFTSTVSVTNAVTSITTVRLSGLTHTFRGDVQAFLTDPGGTRHNVLVRPGWTGSGGGGNGGNYNAGVYDFVETGGGTVNQGGTDINGGTYNQFLNTGGGMWTSGTYVINNTPLNSITGAAGTWTLTLVDWWLADTGSITGWTLEGTDTAGFVNFCDPGAAGIIACPCGNPPSGAGRGCNNFGAASGGASFTSTGTASLTGDTVILSVSGENNTSLTVFWQGKDPVHSTGVAHAAGVRCVTASLKRLYTGSAAAGTISRPGGGDATVSAQSSSVGDTILAGEARHYFTIYRDPQAAVPCGDTSSTVNVSNAGTYVWAP
jgi:hypothetical protein